MPIDDSHAAAGDARERFTRAAAIAMRCYAIVTLMPRHTLP